MSEVTIVRPDTTEMSANSLVITMEAAEIDVVGQDTLDHATAFLQRVKSLRDTIAEKFKEPVANAYKANRSMKALMDEIDKPAKDAWGLVKGKIADFTIEQARVQREEQERLREAARKEAEYKQLEEAVRLENEGHLQAADEVMSAPVMPVAPIAVAAPPKAKGLTVRKTWKARILDPTKIPGTWLMPNLKAIDAYARSMGSEAVIPGVEFYEDTNVAVRAK